MLAALGLSVQQCGLDEKVMHGYEKRLPMLLSEAQVVDLSEANIEPIMAFLAHDKKNKGEKPRVVLLEAVGRPVWGVAVDYDAVKRALEYVITKEYGKR
jgi:3-dehydroquinate synthetase